MTRQRWWTIGLAVAGAISLGGCGSVPVTESKVEPTLEQQTAPIRAGQTDRSQVRALLGTALLTSDYWRFDLFHISDRRVIATLMLVPVYVSVSDVHGYVLVAYDEHWKVVEYEQGITSEVVLFEITDRPVVRLRAGPLRFGDTKGRDEMFLGIDAARRDEFLSQHPVRDACRVLVGCASSHCGVRFTVDAQPKVELTNRATGWDLTLAPVPVAVGRHRLHYESTVFGVSFDGTTDFNCASGESLYALIDTGMGRQLEWQWHPKTSVSVSKVMPEAWRDLSLLLYRGDRWLVPAEPGKDEQTQ
jgi:hypothetical protein